jgi:Asp-tRNA(Asn)/Glu-tRNA(Gln) amidotransferase A subunit family amidase
MSLLVRMPSCSVLNHSANVGTDEPDAVEGAPCAIQLVGRPFRDEEVLKIMAIVSDLLKART